MEIFIIILSITSCVCLGVYWFAKYFDEDDDDLIADFMTKTTTKPPTVTCEYCGCEVKQENAYKVKHNYSSEIFFCKACKPNYDEIQLDYEYKRHYYKKLEVTKNGEPVGYKKK